MEGDVQSAMVKFVTVNEIVHETKGNCEQMSKKSAAEIHQELLNLRIENQKIKEINAQHELQREDLLKEIANGEKNLAETKEKLTQLSKKLAYNNEFLNCFNKNFDFPVKIWRKSIYFERQQGKCQRSSGTSPNNSQEIAWDSVCRKQRISWEINEIKRRKRKIEVW